MPSTRCTPLSKLIVIRDNGYIGINYPYKEYDRDAVDYEIKRKQDADAWLKKNNRTRTCRTKGNSGGNMADKRRGE